jgi:phosphoesterase RecJ-like protein
LLTTPRGENTGVWGTSASIAEIADFLRGCESVAVMTHVKPDGDAVGSTLALTRSLNLRRPGTARAWYFGPKPPWFAALAGDTPVGIQQDFASIGTPSGVAVLDTGSWTQLEAVQAWLRPQASTTCIIDHHAHGDPDVAVMRFVDTASAAACQPAAELCCAILGVDAPAALPREVATPLYLGLATDTGWFRHSNVTRAVMSLAGELVASGVDHAQLYETIEQQERLPRLKLLARALDSLEILHGGRIAIMHVTREDFESCSATSGDTGGFVDHPQTIASVRVVALLSEADPTEYGHGDGPLTKISFRSKSGPSAVDVNRVAQLFGGGGHVRAAGAKVKRPLADVRNDVVAALKQQFH